MTILNFIPAIIRVLFVFCCILIAIRKKLSLGHSFLLGSVLLGLLFGLTIEEMGKSIFLSIINPKTLSLALIVSLILILSSSMELSGQMKRLLTNFQGLVINPGLNLVLFPALIGLLPMPGGAIFSAPMVKELGKRSELPPAILSYINYWFRHIWEYWWPLYPGILLTITLANINLWELVLLMFPLTAVSLYTGYRPVKKLINRKTYINTKRPKTGPFFKELVPILMVIILGLSLGFIGTGLWPELAINKELGLIIALCIAIGYSWRSNNLSSRFIAKILTNRHILTMMYMVISILIFKGMMEYSHAVSIISDEFKILHVPLILIVIILPLFVGSITGITIAFVGSTFPIIIPLIHAYGEAEFMIAYIMLALTSGFIGVLLSPLHLCLLLSNQFFDITLENIYPYLWKPCLYLLASAITYFIFLRWLIV